jgi:predicted patatin/cPLA2 family phospholipase
MQRLERIDNPDSKINSLQDLHALAKLMWERLKADSTRGQRDDGRVIALAIEGGGHSGVISAGMCVFLEASGLIDAVDIIYGTSSGALNGSFTASGQAAIGSTNYEETANRHFSNPMRILKGKSVIDFNFLFDDVIKNRKPYDPIMLKNGPDFRAVATNLKTRDVEILKDFKDVDDLMTAVRVSCSIPFVTRPIVYRGMSLTDGALTASVPFKEALNEEATDVLVLRTKTLSYECEPYSEKLINWVRRYDSAIADLLESRPAIYNEDAKYLETSETSNSRLAQITIPEKTVKISRLEYSAKNIRKGLYYGALSAANFFGIEELNIYWQPSIHLI